jgi:hypothetical protein
VYKVRHKLDGNIYAVKKVELNIGQGEQDIRAHKMFREIRTMNKIHHNNTIQYFTSWVEFIET